MEILISYSIVISKFKFPSSYVYTYYNELFELQEEN